jgi:predicted nucleic acid-binding protein
VSAIVTDTSPIRALAHLGLMDLLRTLGSQVLIPPAVDHELKHPAGGLAAVDIALFPFISVQVPQDPPVVQHFRQTLHQGEAEAIALALEAQAKTLIIDEARGRRLALRVGLKLTGVLGLLLDAKRQGLISAVGPLMDRLVNEINFFIAPSLRSTVLQLAGESATP